MRMTRTSGLAYDRTQVELIFEVIEDPIDGGFGDVAGNAKAKQNGPPGCSRPGRRGPPTVQLF